MHWKRTEQLVAAAVFLYALILYVLTVAPTASFWDSGEFIAIANRLEVSHPPGAPFYMLVGRLFSMFVPMAYVSLSINLISVLASALTILLAHLIIVRLVREWQGESYADSTLNRWTGLIAGIVGATTFAVTDSFWFNAVEAEVYALSMFFTAIVVWLILKWTEEARIEEARISGGRHPFSLAANRYLVLIAYLFGLAIGVHLLNLLAIFFIALVVFYTEFERGDLSKGQFVKQLVVTGVVSALAFLLIYPGITVWLPSIAGATNSTILTVAVVAIVATFSIRYTQKHKMAAANLVALTVTMVLIGYSTYGVIFIRSAADPPIDENDPENTEAIVSYLKREQYGTTPIFRGATFDNRSGQLGQTEVTFPRRHSPDQNHWREYRRYSSDLDFFLKYQVGHMYLRYFAFNFVGRVSDVQDAPFMTGISFLDRGKEDGFYYQTPSERAARNAYFALPLLLGLLGLVHHFVRDSRRAFAVLVLFLMTGIGIIIYLNQPPLQPRERDYAYVASFFAFALWIGIGAAAILEFVRDVCERRELSPAATRAFFFEAGAVVFVAVPLLMLVVNFDDHDRSGRYVAPDYAYNMLMSTAENAVIFTNGDNDTFPLWYLQEVEGIRRDVRVANLSLMNTPWYINQLKNQWSRESEPLPFTMSDDQIKGIGPRAWRPSEITLPVNKKTIFSTDIGLSLQDTSRIESPMKWTLQGRKLSEDLNYLHAADQAALDIIVTNARNDWSRPVYFAVTVSPDGQLDLQNFFQLEGQAQRIVPIRHDEGFLGRVSPDVTVDRLRQFRFRGLDDPGVYFDENIRNMLDNYRSVFAHTAQSLAQVGRREEALALLDTLMAEMPFETIPGDANTFIMMANAYHDAGNQELAVNIARRSEPIILRRLRAATTQRQLELAARFVQLIRLVYMEAGDFEAASLLGDRVADVFGDSTFRQSPDELKRLYERSFGSPPAAQEGS